MARADVATWRPWRVAWQDALYGEGGFYRRPEGPAGHFETSANAGGGAVDVVAGALATLAASSGCSRIVDIGAGRGELLRALAGRGLELLGVDVVGRPPALPDEVAWLRSPGGPGLPPDLRALTGSLVLAHEWLDVVPCEVLEVDDEGAVRVVEVDGAGHERLGPLAGAGDLEWCARWWPLSGQAPGTRAEVGRSRDQAWLDLLGRLESGIAVAVDYGHRLDDRPPSGTLAAHREGRLVAAVPDGSVDLTAHVAWDSLAGGAGVRPQSQVLRELGVDGRRPPLTAATGPGALSYLRDLQRAAAAQTVLDPDGLGGLGWLLHAKVVR